MTLRLLMKFAVAAVMLLLLLLFSSSKGVDFVYKGF
jgi:hypothetical protein